MDDEAERKDRNHDGDEWRGHKVAAQFEDAVTLAEERFVSRHRTELPDEGVDDGEEVDRAVQQEENNQEGATHRLDEFLADRRIEYKHLVCINAGLDCKYNPNLASFIIFQ